MDQMRIVSWNLQGAFGAAGRAAEQAAHLLGLAADVLLLQESPSLRSELSERFWWHREATPRGWGTAVALSRDTFTACNPLPNPKPHRQGRIANVRTTFREQPLRVISVHPQATDSQSSRASSASGWLVDLNVELDDEPALIGGDWNTGRPTSRSLFPRAAEAGWYECAQLPPEVPTHLHRTKDGHSPWTIDHVFCRKLPVTHLTHVDLSADHLSDHRPLVVDLEFWPPRGTRSVDSSTLTR